MATRLLRFTWILLVVIAVFLLSCTDILLEKGGSIQVSLSMADAPGGRNALAQDEGTQYKVKGWIVDTQGEVIEEVEDYLVDGSGIISFTPVEIQMNVRVLIQVYNNDDAILYSGVSDFFVVAPAVNFVPVELQLGDFRKWFGPVGTVEVNFTVEKPDWASLIDFPSNDLYILSYIVSSDNVVQGESRVAGEFGYHSITFSNVPAETDATVYVTVYYNPRQKYSFKEVTPYNDGQMRQYILHMGMSDSFFVKEDSNTVPASLFSYDNGDIAQNGYAYSCSSQEEIKNIITHAPTYISLENNVLVTETITINKDISFMPRGDIITIGIAGSFLRAKNITGPMFEVTTVGSLDLEGFSLDGQEYTGDSPLIVSEGDLTLGSCELINYNCSSTNQGVVYVTKGSVSISYTNITVDANSGGNALYLEEGVTYSINNQSGRSETDLSYKAITAESF